MAQRAATDERDSADEQSSAPNPLGSWRAPISDEEFDFFRALAYEHAGISIADYKRNMVYRRIAKRLQALGLETIADYQALLLSGTEEDESEALINALTTNKTSFFREPHHFEHLTQTALPTLMQARQRKGVRRLRLWSAGCSSGQEPYSIAMATRTTAARPPTWDVRILATDIDTEMVAKGKRGLYPNALAQGIPADLRAKYVRPSGSGASAMAPELTEMITFKPLNLMSSWPMKGPLDVIFCRNVVIYFDKETQKRLFDRFADLLSGDGYLYIGHSESLYRVTERFSPVGTSAYRKIA